MSDFIGGGNTMPGISMPSAMPSPGMNGALGNGLQMGGANAMQGLGGLGNGITPAPGGGVSYAPSTSMDMGKMADALKGFGGDKKQTAQPSSYVGPSNTQAAYQAYLNAFNAQNKG